LAKDFLQGHLGRALPLYYIATMRPVDDEDEMRIERHRAERASWGFITVEQHVCIEDILHKCDTGGSFLLDSLTALLANEMFPPDGGVDKNAGQRVIGGLEKVLGAVGNIVVVSDYLYSDAAVYDPQTEGFRQALAGVDRVAAKCCDAVLEIAYSGLVVHKGSFRGISGEIA
jgi:adenosylcobinamide kinase/adenosylcobinamide-phosphate guanylyltransferase